MTEESSEAIKKCPDCGVEMLLTRNVKFRCGGGTGVLARVGEVWEEFLPFDLRYCSRCGQVRFYKPTSS